MTRPQKLRSAAAERNMAPLTEVLSEVLPASGLVLEVASGSGQHVISFAHSFPNLVFQPSDISASARESIAAYLEEAGIANVQAPIEVDCTSLSLGISPDAVLCINMVHISPWEATQGLLTWCGRALRKGAPLVLYGPYWVEGREREESNLAFDASLKSRDSRWGIRELADLEAVARDRGLALDRVVSMPANNIVAVFRKYAD